MMTVSNNQAFAVESLKEILMYFVSLSNDFK